MLPIQQANINKLMFVKTKQKLCVNVPKEAPKYHECVEKEQFKII